MKILLVTESWDLTTGPTETPYPFYRAILERLGHEVRVVDPRRNRLPMGGPTTYYLPKLLRVFGARPLNQALMNRALLRQARAWRPDLILLFKAENVFSRTIATLRAETGATLFNWSLDSPFWPGNTSMQLLRSLPLYHGFGVLGKHFVPVLYACGCEHVEYVPMFFNVERMPPDIAVSAADRARFACDVLFVGVGNRERADRLRRLAEMNIDLAVWGNWSAVSLAPGDPLRRCLRGGYLDGRAYAKALKCCRVAVNFLQVQCRGANNIRTFEVPGCGAFLLTEYSREQAEELMTDGRDLVCYHGADDLRAKLQYYLEHPAERDAIAAAGQARVLREHTLEHRLRQITDWAAAQRERAS